MLALSQYQCQLCKRKFGDLNSQAGLVEFFAHLRRAHPTCFEEVTRDPMMPADAREAIAVVFRSVA